MSSHSSFCKCQTCIKIIKIIGPTGPTGPTGPIGPAGPTGSFKCHETGEIFNNDCFLVKRNNIQGFQGQFAFSKFNPIIGDVKILNESLILTVDSDTGIRRSLTRIKTELPCAGTVRFNLTFGGNVFPQFTLNVGCDDKIATHSISNVIELQSIPNSFPFEAGCFEITLELELREGE